MGPRCLARAAGRRPARAPGGGVSEQCPGRALASDDTSGLRARPGCRLHDGAEASAAVRRIGSARLGAVLGRIHADLQARSPNDARGAELAKALR